MPAHTRLFHAPLLPALGGAAHSDPDRPARNVRPGASHAVERMVSSMKRASGPVCVRHGMIAEKIYCEGSTK